MVARFPNHRGWTVRIESGVFDATYLALAGLTRLGLEQHAASLIDSEVMPPAPGQRTKSRFALTVEEATKEWA